MTSFCRLEKRLKLPAMCDLNLSDIQQMALNDQENRIGLSPAISSLCTLNCINLAQLDDAAFLKSSLESLGSGDTVRLIVRNPVSHEEDEKENMAQSC